MILKKIFLFSLFFSYLIFSDENIKLQRLFKDVQVSNTSTTEEADEIDKFTEEFNPNKYVHKESNEPTEFELFCSKIGIYLLLRYIELKSKLSVSYNYFCNCFKN